VTVKRVGMVRGWAVTAMTALVLLTAACTGASSETAPKSGGTVTTGSSHEATERRGPAPPAMGGIPRCESAQGTPLFKASLATGVPETYVRATASLSATRLCYSLSARTPSAFPDLQPCGGMTGRQLEGPLELTSGQRIWLTGPSGLTNSGPDPCSIPYG
jgi:hypothetical protein